MMEQQTGNRPLVLDRRASGAVRGEQDEDIADFARGAMGRPRARVLLVGSGVTDAAIEALAIRAGARVIARVAHGDAARHLARMAAVDIVWLTNAEAMSSGELVALLENVGDRECVLICETALDRLDAVVAAVPADLPVDFMVDPDDADRLIALAAAATPRSFMVHDVARGDVADRIDRLQDEVARISRLLGELAGQQQTADGSAAYALRTNDIAGAAAQLRAPQREFAAGPRSFVPEEPLAAQRFKARQVRRLIRQRRVRDQFFPADLFADPAWDMLLDLYAARLERQPVSVSSLCIAAAVPATTALRWIKTMTDADIFVREADPHDGRRIYIALADQPADAMARYFEALEE